MHKMQPKIKFKLEDSDIEFDFTPDFGLSTNYTDETKVSWRLPSRGTPVNVGVLCDELQDEGSIHPTIRRSKDV
tara:strand:+ start:210 stop:431 length:222 start_codon:yes stop_codon:yes gene_type:complete